MISIAKFANDLDRMQASLQAATDSYRLAIRSVSHYAVEAEPQQAAEFREHLKRLEQQWEAAKDPEEFRNVQASFRGELREYRDRTQEQLKRLRKELENAAIAMASFATGITASGTDCEVELKRELQRLEEVSVSEDLSEIRGGIRIAVGKIAETMDQLQSGNQLIIAQLQDEIRVLHQEVQAERKAFYTDPASGAWTRQKVDLKIHDKLRQGDRFSVIAIAIRNFSSIKADCSQSVLEGTLKAAFLRLRGVLGEEAMIGRWSEGQFVALLDIDPTTIPALSAALTKKLSGPYAVQENGVAHSVTIDPVADGIERVAKEEPAAFVHQLERLTQGLKRVTRPQNIG